MGNVKEKQKLLTISVAAYQVEDYLEETLASFVLPEIMEELEVLIVNDGSKDATPDIAKRFEQKYPDTFRLIDKENGGHGSTINCGIEQATGLYFKVVDGDDWLDRAGFFELMQYLRESTESMPDMVINPFHWIENETGKIIKQFPMNFSNKEYRKIYHFADISGKIYVNMHALTYRTELLKKHPPKLDEHCFYVDAEYVLLPIPYVQTVVFLEKPVYMYRIGRQEQSMNLTNMQKNCHHHERVLERLLLAYEELHTEILDRPKDFELEEKRRYLAKGIAKISASQIKIYLSYPPSKEWKKKIMSMEKRIRENYPEVYAQNQNKAVMLLRKSRYTLYGIASRLLKG